MSQLILQFTCWIVFTLQQTDCLTRAPHRYLSYTLICYHLVSHRWKILPTLILCVSKIKPRWRRRQPVKFTLWISYYKVCLPSFSWLYSYTDGLKETKNKFKLWSLALSLMRFIVTCVLETTATTCLLSPIRDNSWYTCLLTSDTLPLFSRYWLFSHMQPCNPLYLNNYRTFISWLQVGNFQLFFLFLLFSRTRHQTPQLGLNIVCQVRLFSLLAVSLLGLILLELRH